MRKRGGGVVQQGAQSAGDLRSDRMLVVVDVNISHGVSRCGIVVGDPQRRYGLHSAPRRMETSERGGACSKSSGRLPRSCHNHVPGIESRFLHRPILDHQRLQRRRASGSVSASGAWPRRHHQPP